MKNAFTEDWEKMKELRKACHTAEESGDKAAQEKARSAYRKLREAIEEKGESYCRLYRAYKDAMERGNEAIDFNEAIWDKEVEGLVASLREYGIETFTFSSTWSSAVKTAWLFKENGCSLEGLVEINGTSLDESGNGYEKEPAYLFRVN